MENRDPSAGKKKKKKSLIIGSHNCHHTIVQRQFLCPVWNPSPPKRYQLGRCRKNYLHTAYFSKQDVENIYIFLKYHN